MVFELLELVHEVFGVGWLSTGVEDRVGQVSLVHHGPREHVLVAVHHQIGFGRRRDLPTHGCRARCALNLDGLETLVPGSVGPRVLFASEPAEEAFFLGFLLFLLSLRLDLCEVELLLNLRRCTLSVGGHSLENIVNGLRQTLLFDLGQLHQYYFLEHRRVPENFHL